LTEIGVFCHFTAVVGLTTLCLAIKKAGFVVVTYPAVLGSRMTCVVG
jgi:hypothetical protein